MSHFIAQQIGLPLFDLLKSRNVRAYIREFRKTLSMSRKEVKDYQLYKLKRLLAHAYENVPFYRKRMDSAGFNPNAFSNTSQLTQLPCLERDDLQNNWSNIFADNFNRQTLSKGSSSGSTGVPIVYFKDSNASSSGQAAGMIGWEFSGWQLGDKGLHIWGQPSLVNEQWKSPMSRLKAKIYNHHKFPACRLTTANEFHLLSRQLEKGKYEFLDGYTNAIYLLADFIQQNKIKLNRFKYVFPTAENLLGYQRELIEEVLGPVTDMYGCSEINGIANECPHCGNYHIIDPHVFVEFGNIVDTNGSCELIITDLDNYGFPLIRYKNGDLALPSSEQLQNCNIPFSTFKKVVGRQSDMIKLPDGGVLSVPSFLGSMILEQVTGIKQYQIVRTSDRHLEIRFVLNSNFTKENRLIIEKSLKDYLKDKMTWNIKIVSSIPVSKTGKFKLLIDTVESAPSQNI